MPTRKLSALNSTKNSRWDVCTCGSLPTRGRAKAVEPGYRQSIPALGLLKLTQGVLPSGMTSSARMPDVKRIPNGPAARSLGLERHAGLQAALLGRSEADRYRPRNKRPRPEAI